MRNPERMADFFAELEKEWKRVPDWRFAQLMVNFMSAYGDPFYFEEDKFLEKVREYLDSLDIKQPKKIDDRESAEMVLFQKKWESVFS